MDTPTKANKKYFQIISSFFIENRSYLYVFMIVVVAFVWRIWNLIDLPKNLSLNEIHHLKTISNLINSNWKLPANDIFNAFYIYFFAILAKIIGFKILFFRIVQVIIGTLTVYLFYLFSKEWFNRQVALLSSLFLAVDAFHVAISREIDPSIFVILFFVLILYIITFSLRSNKTIFFILGGIFSGLSLYVDKIFIFMPIAFIVSFIYFYRLNNKILTVYWKKYLVFCLLFILVSLPFIYYLPNNIGPLLSSYSPGSFGQYFLNLGTAVKSLFYESVPGQLYYIGLEPILSPFIAISFVCGLIYAIFHLERRKYFFLVILLTVILGIISFSSEKNALNYLLLLPIAFILASIILDYFLTTWLKTFPYNKIARVALTFILSFFIFLTAYYNFEKYYYAWGENNVIQKQFIYTFNDKSK